MFTRMLAAGLLVLSIGAAQGCGGEDDGFFQPNWTIAGGTDPASCSRVRASQMRLVVLDRDGFVIATRFAPCTNFTYSLGLHPATYSATATFLDPNNVVVSRTAVIAGFNVSENQTTSVAVPFALADFF